jgi:hypothetical protein
MRRLLLSLSLLLLTAGAQAQGINQPGEAILCNTTAQYAASTSGLTKVITGVTGKRTYICGFVIQGGGAVNVGLSTGTGTNCATGTAAITPAFVLASGTVVADTSPYFRGLGAAAATDVCVSSSGAVASQVLVYYGQY